MPITDATINALGASELLAIFDAYGNAVAALEGAENRPSATEAVAAVLDAELARLYKARERIAERLAIIPMTDCEHVAAGSVAAFLATGTPCPAWAVSLVAGQAATS